jgi:hypothetical protein
VPELLDQEYSPAFYDFRHSNYTGRNDRTRDTARAFCEGVWGSYGTSTDKHILDTHSFLLPEGIELQEQSDPDWLIKFYNFCDKYIEVGV